MTTNTLSGASLRFRDAIAVSLIGLPWALVGVSGLAEVSGLVAALVVLVALATTAATLDHTLRAGRSDRPARPRDLAPGWGTGVQRLVIALAALAALSIVIFVLLGRPWFIAPTICLGLGACLYPLARLLDQPPYRVGAIGLVVVAAVAGLLMIAGPSSAGLAVCGLGAAAVLWTMSVLFVRQG